ncbi:MAG: DUF4349 domain-containing protein [Flavobacteriaceae bacterium]|nr:DUF4349 domain-containing protein [Flavobacteriaceae bacterium]
MQKVLFTVLVFLLVVSCENTNSPNKSAHTDMEMPDRAMVDAVHEYEEGPADAKTAAGPKKDKKIIRTSTLEFPSQHMDTTYTQIAQAVKTYGGYMQQDKTTKLSYRMERRMTIRVPNAAFSKFIAEISNGVAQFDTKDISAQDVSEQFIDLEARLKAKRALESRYLELLKKAKNVKEMLEIERELANIREEIEAKQGRIKYLSNQVSYSTVHISFYQEFAKGSGVHVSYAKKMGNAISSGFNALSSFFLGLLYIWPFLLLVGVLVWWFRRKWKKRNKK